MTDFLLAYITTKDKAEARSIGCELVSRRLAACVNILSGVESHYWWEGKIDSSEECVLIAKTDAKYSEPLIQAVKALHSYSVPCVVFFKIESGNPGYMDWLKNSLTPGAQNG